MEARPQMRSYRDATRAAHQGEAEFRPAEAIARPFVEKIEAAQVKSVEAIMGLADALIEARTALKPQGLYYRIFSDSKQPLPGAMVSMSSSTADKITSIREQKALSDPSTWKGLPSAWTALYALCGLSEAEVRRGVERGEITPDMTVQQAKAYTAALYPKSEAPIKVKPKGPTLNTAEPEAAERPEDAAQQGKTSAAEQEITKTPAAVQQIQASGQAPADGSPPITEQPTLDWCRVVRWTGTGRNNPEVIFTKFCTELGWSLELLGEMLLAARYGPHPRVFSQWLDMAVAYHLKLAVVIALVQKDPPPTEEEWQALFLPSAGAPDEQDGV